MNPYLCMSNGCWERFKNMRLVCVRLIVLVLVLGGCRSIDLGKPLQVDSADWTSQGGAERHHFVNESLDFPLEEAWRYNLRAGFGAGAPLVVDGTVIASGLNGEVHALALKDGNRLGREEFGKAVEGVPVATDKTLYVPVAWDEPGVVAYNLVKGKVRWRYKGAAVEAGLCLWKGQLFAADVEGRVTAFDGSTGDTTWTMTPDSLVTYLATPVVAQERLIVVDDRGLVRALDPENGSQYWQKDTGEAVAHAPAVWQQTVYVPSTNGTLTAIDVRSGEVQWRYQTREQPRRLTTPALSKDMLVVGVSDGTVRRLHPENGRLLWSVKPGGPVVGAPLLLENAIIAGSLDQHVYALDPRDGKINWQTKLKGRIKSAPAMQDRHLIILAEPSYVYAFVPTDNPSVVTAGTDTGP